MKNNITMDKILNLFVKIYMYAIHSRIIAARGKQSLFSCVKSYVALEIYIGILQKINLLLNPVLINLSS